MSRRKCCCCPTNCTCPGPPPVTIVADGTATWFTHEVAGGVITRVDHSGPCKTYWVNSVAGGGAETGAGTEANPWTNLNTVFSNACIFFICGHQPKPDCCPKVKVLVKGTIDYGIAGNTAQNYLRNLIVEPWGAGPITITVSGTGTVYTVRNCIGAVWKNTTANGTGTSNVYGIGYGFYGCNSSAFDTCTGSGTGTGTGTGNGSGVGFDFCTSSAFDTCTGSGTGTGTGGYGHGFSSCHLSTLVAGTGTGTGTGTGGVGVGYGYGFYYCLSSALEACTGQGYATSASGCAFACGFYLNTGASFLDCSTTDKICTAPCGVPCPWNCDI